MLFSGLREQLENTLLTLGDHKGAKQQIGEMKRIIEEVSKHRSSSELQFQMLQCNCVYTCVVSGNKCHSRRCSTLSFCHSK